MKRGGPLKRTTALTSDPVKRAAFIERGRGGLTRTRKPLGRAAPTPLLPGERGWTQRVFALYGRRCVVCGRKAVHAHHAVGKAVILAAWRLSVPEREALAYDERAGVPCCFDCHMNHEAASRRIPFDRLPPAVVAWAIEHGFRGRIMDRRVYPREGV